MRKISYIVLNVLLGISLFVDILILAKAQNTSAWEIITILEVILICILIPGIVFINIYKKKSLQEAGIYIGIAYSILIFLSFFVGLYFWIANIVLFIAILIFSILFLKNNDN